MIRINPELGYLKVAQEQERQIELSRLYHLQLAQVDEELAALDANSATMTDGEFNFRVRAIEERRATLQELWKRENA